MLRMEQGKRPLNIRIAPEGYDHIKGRADDAGVDVSTMVRRMLAFASIKMPAGWKPPAASPIAPDKR